MSNMRNANIQMLCPWISANNGMITECIRERCPYYDFETKTVVVAFGRTETYDVQSCRRVDQQSVELEIIANIFRELKNLLKEDTK